MAYHFKNLVFEGGGVKGVAYVGAMEVLQREDILGNIVRVGGTSAGAINALLAGLGYSPEETRDKLLKLNFSNFLDDSWGVVRDADRLINQFGWYKGDFFRQWAADLVEEKSGNPNATFQDIQGQEQQKGFRDMYFMGTNLSTGFAEVFSCEHTPRMCVADAVRISMSIPLLFAAKRSLRGDIYVDGGVLDNYPVKLFDREKYVEQHSRHTSYYDKRNEELQRMGKRINPYCYNQETLGFRLDSAKEIAVFRDQAEPERHKIEDFFDYAVALVTTIMNIQESRHLHSDDWQRTIYIDTLGVGTTDFELEKAKKLALIDSGKTYTEKYLAKYNDPNNTPANRP